MSDVTTLRSRLSDAEAALHDLLTTGATQTLRHGDKWMISGKMSENGLRAYIAELKGQLYALGDTSNGRGRIRARAVIF